MQHAPFAGGVHGFGMQVDPTPCQAPPSAWHEVSVRIEHWPLMQHAPAKVCAAHSRASARIVKRMRLALARGSRAVRMKRSIGGPPRRAFVRAVLYRIDSQTRTAVKAGPARGAARR